MRIIAFLFVLLFTVPAVAQSGVATGMSVTATGGTTARTLAAMASDVFNVKNFGATGNGTTDDSVAIAAAENAALAQTNGKRAAVYFPGGTYLLGAGATLPVLTAPLRLFGDGPHKTYIRASTAYVGDFFAASEVWQSASYASGMASSADNAGLAIDNLTLLGNASSTNVNNGIALYDRDDFVSIRDVDMFYLSGVCLKTGATKNQSVAYTRESSFVNLRCFNSGTASEAAVDVSSTSISGSDATNELKFVNLSVFSSVGIGLQVRNPNNFNATRLIEFTNPRVEFSAGDNIQIGSSADAGQVDSIRMYGLESLTPGQTTAGHYALNIDTAGLQVYDVMVLGGQLGPCWTTTACNGANLGNTRLTRVQLENVSVTGTSITYASTIGPQVVVDGNGSEQNWTYSINSGVLSKVISPLYRYGDPTSASGTTNPVAITSGYHDGTATFGNAAAAGAVDLQVVRNSATQVAALTGSVLIGGAFNSVAGNGSQGAVIGGATNTVSGFDGFIGGGVQGTDRGRTDSQAFAAQDISTLGDAQSAHFVLSATCSTCSSNQLTAAHGAASTTNEVNISNGQSYALTARCIAHDTTTAGTDLATIMPIMLLTRDTNVASTALVAGTAASVSRGTWTGGSFAFSADTTNGGLNISFTAPTGNTDTFHEVCELHDAEVQ